MSALRLPGPDGRTILVPIDNGAVGRISHSVFAIRGGYGNPVVSGTYVVGESDAERHRRVNRELKARKRL
jgi:hypothetical protein